VCTHVSALSAAVSVDDQKARVSRGPDSSSSHNHTRHISGEGSFGGSEGLRVQDSFTVFDLIVLFTPRAYIQSLYPLRVTRTVHMAFSELDKSLNECRSARYSEGFRSSCLVSSYNFISSAPIIRFIYALANNNRVLFPILESGVSNDFLTSARDSFGFSRKVLRTHDLARKY